LILACAKGFLTILHLVHIMCVVVIYNQNSIESRSNGPTSSDDEDEWEFSCEDMHHDPESGKFSELQFESFDFNIPASVDLIEDELESSGSFNFSCLSVEDDGVQELESESEQEGDVKEVLVPSWEDEFANELVDLPLCDDGEFDPLGDLRILEDLIYNQTPSVGIDREPSGPGEEVNDVESSKPREKARKEPANRNLMQVRRWSTRKSLKFKHDHSSRYMSCIRFMPGKFKYWWSDPFRVFNLLFNIVFNSTFNFVCIYVNRVELNGLDRVQIKEKPPD